MKCTITFLLLVSSQIVVAQKYLMKVLIKDQKSLQPIAYASVTIDKTFYLSNDYGEVFVDKVFSDNTLVKVTCVGYGNKIDTLKSVSQSKQILLEPNVLKLKEVTVLSLTTDYMAKLIVESIKKSIKENKNAICKTRTYSLENQNKLIELTRAAQNISFANGFVTEIATKCGDITLNSKDINNQFKSEAITYLYLNTNPYFQRTNISFISPFSATNAQSIAMHYRLQAQFIDEDLVQIFFAHKSLNNTGYIIVKRNSQLLVEVCNTLSFIGSYPLITNYPSGSFTDTMRIKTNLYYNNGRWTGQSLSLNFKYKVDSTINDIRTISYLEIKDGPQHHLPVNAVNTNSDYINILAMPVNNLMRKAILQEEPSTIYDNILQSTNVLKSDLQLVSPDDNYISGSAEFEMIQDISLVCFWRQNWELDWSKMALSTKPITNPKSKIDIMIFGDFYCDSNITEFLIEPLFNYNASYYGPNRNEVTKAFIELQFHIAKVKSDELKKYLKTNYGTCPPFEVFRKELMKANKELQKELFLCKLQCNDGLNSEALAKWIESVSNRMKE